MKTLLFDAWHALWAHTKERVALVDPDWEEFKQLYRAFEPTEMEYRGE